MQVLAAITSAKQLALIQAKEGDLWEPSSEEELDQLEAEGLQMGSLQPQTVALEGTLAQGGLPRYGTTVFADICYVLLLLTVNLGDTAFLSMVSFGLIRLCTAASTTHESDPLLVIL